MLVTVIFVGIVSLLLEGGSNFDTFLTEGQCISTEKYIDSITYIIWHRSNLLSSKLCLHYYKAFSSIKLLTM